MRRWDDGNIINYSHHYYCPPYDTRLERLSMTTKKLRKQLLNKPIELTPKQIAKMKQDALNQAVQVTNMIPLLVLRDKFGFGKKRLERYIQHYQEAVESLNNGYIEISDIEEMLLDEVKIGFTGEGGVE